MGRIFAAALTGNRADAMTARADAPLGAAVVGGLLLDLTGDWRPRRRRCGI
jgi:hypothetical protein